MAGTNLLRSLLTLIFTGILFSFFLIIVPLLFIPTFPLRILVKVAAKILRPDLIRMLDGVTASISLDDLQKPKYNMVNYLVVDGILSAEAMRDLFKDRIIMKKRTEEDSTGGLFYPELQQTVTSFLGYNFWTAESNFNLQNHFRPYDYHSELPIEYPCDEEDLRRTLGGLIGMGWKKDSAPWEFLVISNYYKIDGSETLKTVLVSRIHHVYGDGVSVINLIMRDYAQTDFQVRLPKLGKSSSGGRSGWSEILRNISIPFTATAQLAENLIESFDPETCWHSSKKLTKQCFSSFSPAVDVEIIKEIKNRHDVSFAAVLYAAMCGGMRRTMEEAGQVVPESFASFCLAPASNHPQGLVNHFSFVYNRLPLNLKCPINRMQRINSALQKNSKSMIPGVTFWLMWVNGLLPNCLQRLFHARNYCTSIASVFPTPSETPYLLGYEVLESICSIPLGPGTQGMSVIIMGTGGKLRIVANIDKGIAPPENIFRKLGQYFFEELQFMHRTTINNSADLRLNPVF